MYIWLVWVVLTFHPRAFVVYARKRIGIQSSKRFEQGHVAVIVQCGNEIDPVTL